MLVGARKGGWPQIIRRNISASFSSSTPQNHPEKIPFNASPQNSLDFDRNSDLDLRTDSIIEEPRNFEELMLKSLGLDWNADEDKKIDKRKNTKQSQSENHKRKSEKNRKREIKVGDGRKIIGDKTKVKDDSAIAGDDNGDYEVRGNLGDDSLAEGSERTNVKEEEGLFSPKLGNQEVKVEVFESESGRKNLKEKLFSSLLNLKESVAELKEGISVAKEVKGKVVKEMREKEREMDYGLWQPFYNEDVEEEVHNGIHILMSFQCNHLSSIAFSFFFFRKICHLPQSPCTCFQRLILENKPKTKRRMKTNQALKSQTSWPHPSQGGETMEGESVRQ